MPNATVMFANAKGGVGKSTLAYLTAIYLAAAKGLRIVAADLDRQNSLYNSLRRFESAGLRAENWADAAPASGLERGRLMNLAQEARETSDILIIDTPAGFGAAELFRFMRPDLIVVPLSSSDADVFTTKAYLEDLTAALDAYQQEDPDRTQPQILVIPNQVYDAECVSRVRDSLRGLRVQVGRPLPHSLTFREIFRYTEGDMNVGRVVQRDRKFFEWLAERVLARLQSNALGAGAARRSFFSFS